MFSLYCRYCTKHNLILLSKNNNPAIDERDLNNGKKGAKKFENHDSMFDPQGGSNETEFAMWTITARAVSH